MCYSDLSALYGARDLNSDNWPYASADNSVEYPVVTGLVMWVTALLIHDESGYRAYFDLNALLIAILFILATLLVYRLRPELAYLFPVAPAVWASLYINWDIWAVFASLIAIIFLKMEKFELSALALGVAIATKFFPIALLLPVFLYFIAQRNLPRLYRYLLITSATWFAINLPIMLTTFDGWARFFRLNLERGNDLGSIWFAFDLLGISSDSGTALIVVLLLLGICGIGWIYLRRLSLIDSFQAAAVSAFLAVALFVTLSKVYSPQYILWLTPFAVIAMSATRDRSAFWIWQGGEALYHLAIWQYLASYTGAKFGLPENLYALTILVRVATLTWFCTSLVRRPTETAPQYPQPPAAISR